MTRDIFGLWRYRGPRDPKAKAEGTLGKFTKRVHRVGTAACTPGKYTWKVHLESAPAAQHRGASTRANVPVAGGRLPDRECAPGRYTTVHSGDRVHSRSYTRTVHWLMAVTRGPSDRTLKTWSIR